MRNGLQAALLLLGMFGPTYPASADVPPSIPAAIYTDPPHDASHPARIEVLHIPSGAQTIYGIAYLAVGPGPHPTVVLCHGWPGNEKNLDLAQAIRRAGWNVVTFNYRGSWGSPGTFSFGQNPEDAKSVLAFIRRPDNVEKLGIDTSKIVLAGHSMGGWVTATVAGEDKALKGAILISAANMGRVGTLPYRQLYERSAENTETLAGATARSMADELSARAKDYDFMNSAQGLADKPLLILSSDDGLTPFTDELAAAVRKAGNAQVAMAHVETDHSWSDRRIDLASRIIVWLEGLK